MKKIHFYEGLTPLPTHFDDVQNNAEATVGGVARALASAGVLTGLTVSINSGAVVVAPGRAVAPNGAVMALAAAVQVPLSNGVVVLRAGTVDTATATDIQQQTVWATREDTATPLIVQASDADKDVVLGTISSGTYSTAGREAAGGWQSLRELIRAEIATAKDEAINAAVPPGFVYVQYPGMKAPAAYAGQVPGGTVRLDIAAADSLGWPGAWEIVQSYAGAFFRAEGGLAEAFSADNVPTAPQPDAFQGHRHAPDFAAFLLYEAPGDKRAVEQNQSGGAETWSSTTWRTGLPIDDGTNGTPRTASETRPTNYTVRIWKRTS